MLYRFLGYKERDEIAWLQAHNLRSQRVLITRLEWVHQALSELNITEARCRYTRILVGTDKVLLGDLVDFKDKEAVFRTAFGRMTADNLQHYATLSVSEKILLSDGDFQPDGWEVVAFPP